MHLYNQDGTSAWGAFQDAMNVEVFTNSDEAFLADALFTAYRWVGAQGHRSKCVGGPAAGWGAKWG